jgi:murein L,D-transpeptidase YcbB/YkuD
LPLKRLAPIFLILVCVSACNRGAKPTNEEINRLRSRVESPASPPFVTNNHQEKSAWSLTKQFYAAREFHPIWFINNRYRPELDEALQALQSAEGEGLSSADYGVAAIAERRALTKSQINEEEIAFEPFITYSLFLYASDLSYGRLRPGQVDPAWRMQRQQKDLVELISAAIREHSLPQLAGRLAPPHHEYASLRNALSRSQAPPEEIGKMKLNMERWRWAPDLLGDRYVQVNIPAFALEVREQEQVPLKMRVVVGKPENRTPVFSERMQYIAFSPYWNVPQSIAVEETLPMIEKDPDYLLRQNIEVVRVSGKRTEVVDPDSVDWQEVADSPQYQLRQKPGAGNSLGLVKFMFPNEFNVYLHDTPADNLFDRLTRSLSHGCIRLEKPAELAAYVLQDQPEWTPDKIRRAMHAEEEKDVKLLTELPVHIFYFTAWPAADDTIEFFEDVYGYDAKQQKALAQVSEDRRRAIQKVSPAAPPK